MRTLRLISKGPSAASPWIEAFADQVALSPDLSAVVEEDGEFSYRELDEWAKSVADLLAECGVTAGDRVIVSAPRSAAVVAAMIGVVRHGATYVPLDPTYPADRLEFMVSDSAAELLLHAVNDSVLPGSARRAPLPPCPVTVVGSVATPPPINPSTADVYLIYTSGSTGWPKGVGVTRRCVDSMVAWQIRHSVAPDLRTAQFAPLNFDVCFQEILGTLCGGGTLVIVPERLRQDAFGLLEWIADNRIERIFLPCLALQMLAVAISARGGLRDVSLQDLVLREINVAGEQLVITPAIRAMFSRLANCRLNNHYGQSESAMVTAHSLSSDPASWPTIVPIGLPLPGCDVIVDSSDGGESGELLVAGDPLSRGYLNRPDLNAERFTTITVEGREFPAFRTGDLVRVVEGVLVFAGRVDSEVKIRGVRVDLLEVDSVLLEQPGVQEAAAVVVEHDGVKTLYSVVTLDADLPLFDPDGLLVALRARLPAQSVPVSVREVGALMRTPSGKIDRPALARLITTLPQAYA